MKRKIIFFLILTLYSFIGFSQEKHLSQRIANYDIDVILDTVNHAISGKEILTWTNSSRDTLQEFHFHLYLNAFESTKTTFAKEGGFYEMLEGEEGYIQIKSIQFEKGENLTNNQRFISPDDGNKNDKTVLAVKSKRKVLPGETVKFVIKFDAKLPKIKARTGYGKEYYFVAQWFPKIGVYETKTNQDTANWAWNCHQFHANSEFFADFGVYNVKITVPLNYVLGATGIQWDEKINRNNTKTVLYKADDVVDFVWTASPNYLVVTDKWNKTTITFLYQKEHKKQIQRHISSLKIALDYFDKNVGEYPYPSITLIDPPMHSAGAGGMEYPMLITAGTIKFLPEGLKIPELVTIHEFGHQYFMALLASNEFEEAWLDEGINTYYEARIMDEAYGANASMLNLFGFEIGDGASKRIEYTSLSNLRLGPTFNNAWNFSGGSYGTLIYSKPATFLQTLEGLIGRDVMDRILQKYFDKWKFKHPKTNDFIDIVNESVKGKHGDKFGKNMNWFFDQVLFGTHVCDYSVESISNSFVPKGEDLESNGIIAKVRVYRLGDMQLPNEILIHFKDGTETLETWDGKEASTIFTFKGKEVLWAQIDPENKITLDENLANNSKTLEPQTRTFWKYAKKLMLWLQSVMTFFI